MEVTLDGQPVAITVAFAPTDSLPAEWRVPGSTPSLNGSDSVRYVARNEGVIRFTLRIPSGQHIVRVRYRAEPTSNSSGGRATKLWQFAYVLAPARQWDGFGTLEATVTVPSGWEATATPSMARKEDSLTGTWQGIPADAIALSFAMPSPTYLPYLENGLPILASLLGIFFCWVVGSRVGRWLVRTKKTPSWSVPFALLAGGAWALLVLGGMLLASSIVQNELGNQLARGYGYGSAIALILLYMPGAFLAGTLLTVVAAYRAAKRSG